MNNRYTMDAQDLYDGDRPLRDTDIMDRLNEQDDDLTRLKAERAELTDSLRETLEALTWLIKNAPGNYWINWARTAELEARVERAQAALAKAGQS